MTAADTAAAEEPRWLWQLLLALVQPLGEEADKDSLGALLQPGYDDDVDEVEEDDRVDAHADDDGEKDGGHEEEE